MRALGGTDQSCASALYSRRPRTCLSLSFGARQTLIWRSFDCKWRCKPALCSSRQADVDLFLCDRAHSAARKSGELDFDADSRDKNVEDSLRFTGSLQVRGGQAYCNSKLAALQEQVPNLRSPPEAGTFGVHRRERVRRKAPLWRGGWAI